ncbi:MAG: dihydroorotase [Thermodesulfobacteriota bacterium]
MKLVIRGGRVIDPASNLDAIKDVYIDQGEIVAVESAGAGGLAPDCREILAEGKLVVPGLIDMHTHLREPGYEYKETIATGCQAAARGGFTSIACMANTDPVNDNRAVTEYILRQARLAGGVNVFPIGAISQGLAGKELAEMGELKDAGAVAVSDDGRPVMNGQLMRRALEYTKAFDLPVISHCEDLNLSAGGVMNEGPVSTRLGLPPISKAAEEAMVARDLILAELTHGRLHIAHVSCAGSVELIRQAKARGINVSCETAPQYFSLTDEDIGEFNTLCKVNPPLRGREDVEAIKAGLKDGTIDAIASDHAPHEPDAKEVEFVNAASGMLGLETALALTLKLVHESTLTINQAIAKLTVNPARVLGIPKGTLAVGADADIAIIDMDKEWVVDVNKFASSSKNSPFDGWKVKGVADMTLINGEAI